MAQSPFYPQIGYQGSARPAAAAASSRRSRRTPSACFYGAFALAWEIDVWGRIRRSNEAAQQALLATEEFRRGVLLSLVTGVAQALPDAARARPRARDRASRPRNRSRRPSISSRAATRAASATSCRWRAPRPRWRRRPGADPGSRAPDRDPGERDLRAARAQPGSDPARHPARRAPRRRRPRRPGLPSALLERRPDVLQAEHTIASANAQVGVAVANFFPRIGLTALYGGQSTELKDIVKDNFSLWNVAGNAAGPLFQGFLLLEQYRGQVAGWEETKAHYEQTVLTAFAEVSNTLTAQTKFAEALAAQERAVRAYQESVRLSLLRYNSGLAGYYEVLEAQQQLFPAEIALAQVQLSQLLTVVTLYRALGGGWQLTDDAMDAEALASATPGARGRRGACSSLQPRLQHSRRCRARRPARRLPHAHEQRALDRRAQQPDAQRPVSPRSLRALSRASPSGVLAELHAAVAAGHGGRDDVFALAELSFPHASRTRQRDYFLASMVYAYAFLFPGGERRPAGPLRSALPPGVRSLQPRHHRRLRLRRRQAGGAARRKLRPALRHARRRLRRGAAALGQPAARAAGSGRGPRGAAGCGRATAGRESAPRSRPAPSRSTPRATSRTSSRRG